MATKNYHHPNCIFVLALLLSYSTYPSVIATQSATSTYSSSSSSYYYHSECQCYRKVVVGGGDVSGCFCTSPPPALPLPPPYAPPPPPLLPPPSPPPPLSPTPSTPPVSRIQMATKVIQEFKSQIQYDPTGVLRTWTGSNPCEYKGFRCAIHPVYKEPALYSVQFNGFGFAGDDLRIADFIEKLPDVSIFHANSNGFSGSIPESISSLPYLFELDLSNNNYVGEFPSEILEATNLTYLDLRFNSFTGEIPSKVFELDLVALFLNNNRFMQELPSTLWSTPAAFLTLANNEFIGSIPKYIGKSADKLLEVLLLNNQLSGCLPFEIGLLKKVRVFDIERNSITGPIPTSFACLKNMQYLILARNRLYGRVPEEVCTLPKLANFSLSNNYFTEVGPECMKLIEKKVLDLSMNCISGMPNQRSYEECSVFLNSQAESCPQVEEVYCEITADSLSREVSMDPPHPQPALTYSALVPASN